MLDPGDDPTTLGLSVPSSPMRQDTILQDTGSSAEAHLFAWCSRLVLLTESLPAPGTVHILDAGMDKKDVGRS